MIQVTKRTVSQDPAESPGPRDSVWAFAELNVLLALLVLAIWDEPQVAYGVRGDIASREDSRDMDYKDTLVA